MAGAGMKIEWGGFKRAVDGAVRGMGRTQEMAEAVGEMLVSNTQQRFEDETGPDGEKWKPSKRAEEEGGKTLTDNAMLKNSIGYEASPTHVVVGAEAAARAVNEGTVKEYAAAHQFGADFSIMSTKRRVTLPARPFIGVSEEDIEEARDILGEGLVDIFRGRA